MISSRPSGSHILGPANGSTDQPLAAQRRGPLSGPLVQFIYKLHKSSLIFITAVDTQQLQQHISLPLLSREQNRNSSIVYPKMLSSFCDHKTDNIDTCKYKYINWLILSTSVRFVAISQPPPPNISFLSANRVIDFTVYSGNFTRQWWGSGKFNYI